MACVTRGAVCVWQHRAPQPQLLPLLPCACINPPPKALPHHEVLPAPKARACRTAGGGQQAPLMGVVLRRRVMRWLRRRVAVAAVAAAAGACPAGCLAPNQPAPGRRPAHGSAVSGAGASAASCWAAYGGCQHPGCQPLRCAVSCARAGTDGGVRASPRSAGRASARQPMCCERASTAGNHSGTTATAGQR